MNSAELTRLAEALQSVCDTGDSSDLARTVATWELNHGSVASYLAGEWLLAHGHAKAALPLLGKASATRADDVLVAHNHAEALRQCGQLEAAAMEFERAIGLHFHFMPSRQALTDLLEILVSRQRMTGQVKLADQQARGLAHLLNETANLLYETGQGMLAWSLYERALKHAPGWPTALSNLGNVLHQEGRLAEAERCCREALAQESQLGPAWINLGNVLAERGLEDEASACFDKGVQCDAKLEAQADHNKRSGTLFNLLHSDRYSDAEVFERHAAWGRAYADVPAEHGVLEWNPGQPVRVGYLSADFRSHAMRHFLEPLLAGHRDPLRVQVVCYSQSAVEDQYTQRLRSYGHTWVSTNALDDSALVARIRADGIHVLVDCLGHTQSTRLKALARKPAPILMSYLGYLGTTGLPAMDFRITDEWLDPPGLTELQHTERLIRVPGGSVSYAPYLSSPHVNDLPAKRNGHVTFGSLNKLKKLNRNVIALWSSILRELPGSRLLLKTKQLADELSVGRIQGLFEAEGIEASRLDLRPATHGHLTAYHDIDIALDPFPFGGGATTCDALWMGVPVITTPGTRSASRLTHCLLHSTGHPQWSTPNYDAYKQLALTMARDLSALSQHRMSLRGQMQNSFLMNADRIAARLEDLYEQVMRDHGVLMHPSSRP